MARAKQTLLWKERRGNSRAKSFSSEESMERAEGEKESRGEELRERLERA